ncbi:MAG: sulfotransferase [Gammaproteobacteria bacterium]|nr:sulfotransferase [Gammaproteobacteria bacterium]
MLALFGQSVVRFFRLLWLSLWPPRDSAARRSPARIAIILLFLPLLGLVQLLHWLGFLCDEIFFRGYRKVEIRAPVFVTGVPRSGTTMLHRLLAADNRFTTFTTWECLFAPSVTQRRIVQGVRYLDRLVGRPLARLLGWAEKKAFAAMDDIHDMSLGDAEEDYFVFTPLFSCFILVVPFPYATWIWDMGRFDVAVEPVEQRRIIAFYRRAIQRHLYANDPARQFLSKNATFAPFIGALAEEFPDARFVLCLRDPLRVIPSQLSSIADGMELFRNDPAASGFRDAMVTQLHHFYRIVLDPPVAAGSFSTVVLSQLKDDVQRGVAQLYKALDIPLSDAYSSTLAQLSVQAGGYQSRHRYELADYGLDAATVEREFADVYAAWPEMKTGARVAG